MASKNPLGPLRLKLEKPKDASKDVIPRCPKCKSTQLQDYGFLNGVGFTCKKCSHHWGIGNSTQLTPEDKRNFLTAYQRTKEDTLVKYSEDCAVPIDEYNRIEETIENNNEFFRKRLYGE